ncbi:MAG: hypothetical protein U5R49_00420 [Deltaproteobacteria bacterium]|nr:hypothetical protein [Deltaproteobacteria bacterium]
MGTMMTLVFSAFFVLHFLLFHECNGLLRKIGHAIMFCFGTGLGLYGVSLVLAKPQLLSPEALFDLLWKVYRLKTDIRLSAVTTSWYLSMDEIFSAKRLLEFVDVWLIYGPVILSLLIIALLLNLAQLRVSFLKRYFFDSKLLTLFGIAVFYLFFMIIKRPVMGLSDWDLFSYAVYPIGLLGLALFAMIPLDTGQKNKLLVIAAIVSVGWFTVNYSLLNPLKPGTLKLPRRMQPDIFSSYELFDQIPETNRIRKLRKEIVGSLK